MEKLEIKAAHKRKIHEQAFFEHHKNRNEVMIPGRLQEKSLPIELDSVKFEKDRYEKMRQHVRYLT